jgi:presenilin 1
VAKAASFGFQAFAACSIVVLAGLGGTLVLLAVFHMALPALPISILFGVSCFFMVRAFLHPFWADLLSEQIYL